MFDLDKFLSEKFYEEALIVKIKSLRSEDFLVVSALIENLLPNANVFRQTLSLLEELAAVKGKGIAEVLNFDEIKKALSHGSRKEQQIKLRNQLEQLRYPMRFKIKNELALRVEKIAKDYGVNVMLPEELEGETLEFNFKVRGVKDLERKSQKFNALIESKLCEDIFKILNGEEI